MLTVTAVVVVTVALTSVARTLSFALTALIVVFAAFFVRHLAFALAATRFAPSDLDASTTPSGHEPSVTVLVACHDEELVVDGLVRSLAALEYRPAALQIIVVDDGSVDRTAEMLDDLTRDAPGIEVIHRPAGAAGGKSGALNAALRHARGDVTVVFDADHQPRPDVLRRLVRHFEDPAVAAVQGRCCIQNRNDSLITRLVFLDYQAGYLVNEYGRQALFALPAYGGANCAVRTSVLRETGGWNESTVTEDTDLTLRLVLLGHKVRYDVTAVDEEQAVTTLSRYWRQRYRWARGHQQVWRDFRHAVWTSPSLSFAQRVETTMFLLTFHIPAIAALGLLLFPLMMLGVPLPGDGLGGFALWTLLFVGPLVEMGSGMIIARTGRDAVKDLPFFIPLYLVAIAVCVKALVDAGLGRSYRWVTTPRRSVGAELVAGDAT